MASSAFWIAWGIVQAIVPGMPELDGEEDEKSAPVGAEAGVLESATKEVRDEAAAEEHEGEKHGEVRFHGARTPYLFFLVDGSVDGNARADDGQAEEEEEFDYLGYTQERALFFWGDAIRMGIVKAEELPEEVRSRVKTVEY